MATKIQGDKTKQAKSIDQTKAPAKVSAKVGPTEPPSEEEVFTLSEADGEEEMGEEEEMFDETEPQSVVFYEEPTETGHIDLSFPEFPEFESSAECYPPSYYTVSPKERLLLTFAENFRRQFQFMFPSRRPLVLAVRNECGVQKFVCSTIRPTAFVHYELIASQEECAKFVADFVTYEALENPISLPTRLISPASLLRKRLGNSFEMATLLCSMLIGAGFPAVVVSGVARNAVIDNDQTQVDCPYIPKDGEECQEVEARSEEEGKYKLRPQPDLKSHLEEKLKEIAAQKARDEEVIRNEEDRVRQDALDLVPVDRYHYRRSHAWVAIIENAAWSLQPRKTKIGEDGDEVDEPPSAYFIEPSTGFRHETNFRGYIQIDSVWNEQNYYVNRQIGRIRDMEWDLQNQDQWEHFLPGEPTELRAVHQASDENLESADSPLLEKHLDTLRSWVMKLHIGHAEFEQRFPNKTKVVHYRRAVHERFSPYYPKDGKSTQLTLFDDDGYIQPSVRWDWYENRADTLYMAKVTFKEQKVEEFFHKGRRDGLKYYEHNMDQSKPKRLHFYHEPRFDSLKLLEVFKDKIILHFQKTPGVRYYQEFQIKQKDCSVESVVEKIERDPGKPADKDVAVRTYLFNQNQILLKFHYAQGALTASTREFTKPPKPSYGQEIIFDPDLTNGYHANPIEPEPTQLELYFLLLAELKHEEAVKKSFDRRMKEITELLQGRKNEMRNVRLKFRVFDPLRNGAARRSRLQRDEDEQNRIKEMLSTDPDFLLPYLVPYQGESLTYDQSWAAYNACLNDLKTRYVGLLNELQRRYEDLTAEGQALKKFLGKFENQFDNFDYERLVEEARQIELNKRMVQQRLTTTHEEAQKKYEKVKESLMKDKRLSLKARQS